MSIKGKALVWAAIIIAVGLLARGKEFDAGVTTALIAAVSVTAINSLFPDNRWMRGCWPCGSRKV